jgi:hypothetical protein
MSDHAAKYPTGDGDDNSRKVARCKSAECDECAQCAGKELGDDAGEGAKVASGNTKRLRPDDSVHETDGERKAVGVAQHTSESFGCQRRRDFGSRSDPRVNLFDGFADQAVDVVNRGNLPVPVSQFVVLLVEIPYEPTAREDAGRRDRLVG